MYRHGLAVVSMLVVSFAWAQGSDEGALEKCLATKISADDRLAACSSIIDAKSESGRSLAGAYCSRGFAFTEKGELDRAIADYNTAIRFDPKFSIAFNNRGDAFLARNNLDRAIADFTTAIKLDPKNATALGNRGYSYFRKGDLDRAAADFTAQIKLAPDDLLAFINRGNVYRAKQQLD